MKPISAKILYAAGTRGRTKCPAVIAVRAWNKAGTAPQVEEQLVVKRSQGLLEEQQEMEDILTRVVMS